MNRAAQPPAADQAAATTSGSPPGAEAPAPLWPTLAELLSLPSWLNLQLGFAAAPIANPIGGLTPSANWMQQLELDLSAGSGLGKDPSGWREIDHWQAHLRLNHYSGSPNFAAAIGSLLAPQSISYPTGLWLSGASLSRSRRDGRFIISGGIQSIDQDFLVAPAYDAYLFASINDTLNLNLAGLPITPYATPGVSLRWRSGGLGEWRLGSYWLDPQISLAQSLGVRQGLPDLRGSVQVLQWSHAPWGEAGESLAPVVLPGGGPLPRRLPPPLLQLGVLRSDVSLSDGEAITDELTLESGLTPRLRIIPGTPISTLNRALYGSLTLPARLPLGLDNRLWGAAQVGLDPSSNISPLFLAGGWLCQGLFADRPLDVLALGLARSGLSSAVVPGLNWQAVVELNYSFSINERLTLQPLLQWILQPAGNGSLPAIVTTGLQLVLSF